MTIERLASADFENKALGRQFVSLVAQLEKTAPQLETRKREVDEAKETCARLVKQMKGMLYRVSHDGRLGNRIVHNSIA